MKWRRFAIASGILALVVLAGWWWQGQIRQREAWDLVHKALRFQERWLVTGQVRWAFRDIQGRWVERQGRISLAGQTLQVHGQGAELVCRLAGCQLVTKGMTSLRIVPVSAQRLPHAPDRWSLLRRSYRARLGEASEVAGRFVQWVQLAPRSPNAFARRLAIEPKTGMVLAQEVLDCDGTVLSRWEWVKVSGKHRSHFRLPTSRQENEGLRKGISQWRVDGFVPVQRVTARCECCSCGMTMQIIHATDGMADVAIYLPTGTPQEHGCPCCQFPQGAPRATRLGAMTVVVISVPRPIVVIGDAPSETLLRLAQQIAQRHP
jgi:negative regulator of sigma E activity